MAARRTALVLLLARCAAASSAVGPAVDLEAALDSDDQCSVGDAGSCALNALQLKKAKLEMEAEAEAEAESDLDAETETAGDVRKKFFKYYNASLHNLRPYIAKLYKEEAVELRQVNYTMGLVAKSMNVSELVWDHGAKAEKMHSSSKFLKKLPPMTRYLAYEAEYLHQLMAVFWSRYTRAERMRYGIINIMIPNEDGPKEEMGCVDINVNCAAWAKGGSCESHQEYMNAHCFCICQKFRETDDSPALATTAAPTAAVDDSTTAAADDVIPDNGYDHTGDEAKKPHHHSASHHHSHHRAPAGSVVRADTSSCPPSDPCGVATHRGCSKCPRGMGYHNDGCTCRAPLMLEEMSEDEGELALSFFQRLLGDWGATTKEREDHTKELYRGLVSDIRDAQHKMKNLTAAVAATDTKVQAWFSKKR